jgi:RND family efflux transporter MFP subunit
MSPMDGVVSARTVQIGQIISSGITNVGGGSAVLTLSDLSRMYILASVDESEIGSVGLDQSAAITADAFPHMRFKGTVNRIAAKGLNVSNVITFEVRIEVLSDNKTMLKPEMTANVEIIIAEKEETLSIPLNAVTRTREGTFATLVKDDGTSEQTPIELGMSDANNNVEVTKGLEADQNVRLVRAESDSRWRQGSQSDSGRARSMMMMRSMGGGGRR